MPDIEQSTGILFGMACAIIGLCLLLAYVIDDLIRTKAALMDEAMTFEADIRTSVLDVVGDVMVASRIREIARNYESPDNVLLRQKIGRTEWKEGGTPLPALWLMAVADQISPPFPETSPEYTLAGERVL